MSQAFWNRLLTALEQGEESRALARQGRLWMAFEDRGEREFDLFDWAESLRQEHYFDLQLDKQLQAVRRGRPEAMALLLRALGGDHPPTVRVSGDTQQLCLDAPGLAVQPGPLAVTLAELLGARLDQGHLFCCPCPELARSVGPPPVDVETLARSTMGDAEFERELIETFLAEGHRQFASLSRNYVAPTLHSLKGSAAMVGALRLADLLDEQEHALDKQRLPVLEAEFARVVDWLQAHLK